MAADDQSKVLGIVVLARHGDRQGFYQDPLTYTASATAITPLGEVQSLVTSHMHGRILTSGSYCSNKSSSLGA